MHNEQIKSRPEHKPLFHFWRCFWLSFLVISLAYAWYCFYVPSNDIAWADSYAIAQSRAVEREQPIILFFTGKWCVPCRVMKRKVWADEQVKATINSQFIPIEVDISNADNAALMDRYQVKGAPVMIITDPQGNAIDWRAGAIGKTEFCEFLRSSIQPTAK